jgi:hypothetical protein
MIFRGKSAAVERAAMKGPIASWGIRCEDVVGSPKTTAVRDKSSVARHPDQESSITQARAGGPRGSGRDSEKEIADRAGLARSIPASLETGMAIFSSGGPSSEPSSEPEGSSSEVEDLTSVSSSIRGAL